MGTITFETPEGDRQFEIAGEKPTDMELQSIQSVLLGQDQTVSSAERPPNPLTSTWEDYKAYYEGRGTGQPSGPVFTPTHEGDALD